jgi:hypothetical protein
VIRKIWIVDPKPTKESGGKDHNIIVATLCFFVTVKMKMKLTVASFKREIKKQGRWTGRPVLAFLFFFCSAFAAGFHFQSFKICKKIQDLVRWIHVTQGCQSCK